jgi:hypothetical protein
VRTLRPLVAALLALLLAACGGPDTPEERARAFIDQVAESASERAWRAFDAYVADDYGDERGLDKAAVLGLVTRYILANQRIYVFKRVADLRVQDPAHVSAVVYAALAGQPVERVEDLAGMTADLYRFEIELTATAGGAFQVTRGDWRPAQAQELLLGR